ncbi:MAG: MmgE/PrpD family protein [Acidimicrobiia bacterium]
MKAPVLGHSAVGSPTDQLATFVSDLDYDSIPPDAIAQAENILIDSIASALAGRYGDETAQIAAAGKALGGPGDTTVIGGAPLSLVGAVLLNGYQITAVTLCDMHIAALNHVTPGVVSPALALSEQMGVSGKQLIVALACGLESSVRIGLGINFSAFRNNGWHAPGVIGPLGSAATTGSLMGLDQAQMINALGLAGSQSAGTYAAWGTPTVKFHQTRGGVSGLLAALLAREDFKSSQDILTHPDGGIFNTYSDGGDPSAMLEDLGVHWRFGEVNLRRWPAATQFQSIIEATLDLVEAHDPVFEDIEKVSLHLPEDVFDAFGGFGWEDKFRARLSPRFVAAVTLADRRCWVEQFQSERLADLKLTDFARDRVTVQADPSLTGVGARVEIRSGSDTLTAFCPVPKGDGTRPLTRDEIISKFHEARRGVVSDPDADRLLQGLTNLGDVDDVRPLIAFLGEAAA